MKRKLKLQVQTSIDGFIAGPSGEMDWMIWNWDNKLKNYVDDITAPVDTIILGRKLAAGFIPHWSKVAENPDDPEYISGKKFIDTPKIVFTKTLDKSEWKNTSLAKGKLSEEIDKLKNQNGKDIIVYGGSNFVSSLIKEGLIDEFHLFVNPVILGKGMPIFGGLEHNQKLTFVQSNSFDCGITVLQYLRNT